MTKIMKISDIYHQPDFSHLLPLALTMRNKG